MNIIPLSDPDDPRLEPYRDLKREDVQRSGPWFIAEGRLVVQRLLASDYPTVSVLAEPKRVSWLTGLVPPTTPIYTVSAETMQAITGFHFHRGLLACGSRRPWTAAADFQPPTDTDTIALAAVAISDLENLGTLIRTSAALGIQQMLISRQTVDPLSRRVLRVSMGTALKMQFIDWDQPQAWLDSPAHGGGWLSIATTLSPDSIPLAQVPQLSDFHHLPKLVLMGNEGQGLPLEIQQRCRVRAKIPMADGVDSLNVSIAGAITIYELLRDRV